ncbi:unnamed protein product [Durusdinium trenchii]|uniref:Peptidase C14 caspase domain-containing protein n=2 Tax=Durusdinium trenchii TaxID=1381693 RepID=A0ABP0LXG3_9DINO
MGKVCSLLSGRQGPLDVTDVCNAIKEVEQRVEDLGLFHGASRDLTPKAAKQEPLQGSRRSLLIGCNYVGTSNELQGCANDVRRMIPVLEKLGFPSDHANQKVLLDDKESSGHQAPTRANMLEAMDWLVAEAQAGDALLLHYSGHGGREPAEGEHGYHETLVPLDFETAGMLRDTELFERLVKRIPAGCRLTCILDSCHSAGALNLPYIFVGTEEELQKAVAGEAVRMALAVKWKSDFEKWTQGSSKELFTDVSALGKNLWQMYHEGSSNGFLTDEASSTQQLVAVGEVVALTGCRSDQTSADVADVATFGLVENAAGGALTSVLVEVLEAGEELTYAELLERMRQELSQKGFSQVPQFVSSLLVELKQPFKLDSIWVEDTEQ